MIVRQVIQKMEDGTEWNAAIQSFKLTDHGALEEPIDLNTLTNGLHKFSGAVPVTNWISDSLGDATVFSAMPVQNVRGFQLAGFYNSLYFRGVSWNGTFGTWVKIASANSVKQVNDSLSSHQTSYTSHVAIQENAPQQANLWAW